MDIKKTAEEIHRVSVVKSFWDTQRNFGELLMLCTSELSEALEADRKGKHADIPAYNAGISSTIGEKGSAGAFKSEFEEHIKDTVEDEIADAVIRLLDLSEGLGIDLEWHIKQKMRYNEGRPILHNKKY